MYDHRINCWLLLAITPPMVLYSIMCMKDGAREYTGQRSNHEPLSIKIVTCLYKSTPCFVFPESKKEFPYNSLNWPKTGKLF